MSNKSSGASKSGQAANYKTAKRWETNRRARLTKLLDKDPENAQIKAALGNIHYRRKTPVTPFWSASRIRVAELFKLYTGRVDVNIFSNNEKTAGPALMTPGPYSKQKFVSADQKTMFSIGVRAQMVAR